MQRSTSALVIGCRSYPMPGALVFSAQVFNEFCSVMLRPSNPAALSPDRISEILRRLAATGRILPMTEAITLTALSGVSQHGLSFWDALIWAAARENGVTLVYTEDFPSAAEIEGVRFENPFFSLHSQP
jgi:predicted nucleic acid-binding protein